MTYVTSLEKQLAATHITGTSDHPITSIGNHLGHIARAMRMTSQSSESSDIVFVCVDCEAFEFDQSKVTEVGVAVLDTRDLHGVEAPFDRSIVFAKVLSAHYRILEYANLVNKKYVRGCPGSFGFGVSTWIRKSDAQQILNRIFQDPRRVLDCADFKQNIPSSDRKIVLGWSRTGKR
ncbi:hypothetical protein MRB53_038343 [Persea americana]|nr:hypothetical protein MRB53_038343 [Persea americana]